MCGDCKVGIQWSRRNPQDWEVIPAFLWESTPNKGVPTELGGNDNSPGWVFGICVQGLEFENYDHYAVEFTDDSLIVTQWSDDPDDFSENEFVAARWTIKHLIPDSKYPLNPKFLDLLDLQSGDRYNTKQTVEYYVGMSVRDKFLDKGRLPQLTTAVNPWSKFIPPSQNTIRHGVWLPGNIEEGSLYEKHKEVRRSLRWDTWTEGVPIDRIVNGRVI